MNALNALLPLLAGLSLGAATPGSPPEMGADAFAPAVSSPCCEAALSDARTLRTSGNMKAAHQKYHAAARAQVAAGEFPGDALWQAAEISHVLGKSGRTARELDQVAAYAREFGRPNLEVRALFEAAYFHQVTGRDDLARARLDRVQKLLASPEVSDDLRVMVASRVEGRIAQF